MDKRVFRFLARIITIAGIVCLSILFLTSCSLDKDSDVRVIHLSPDSEILDAYLENEDDLEDEGYFAIPYLGVTEYRNMPKGETNLKVRAKGSSYDLMDTDIELPEDSKVSVVIANRRAQLMAILIDDKTDKPGDDQSKFRIVDMSSNMGALDVFFLDEGEELDSNTQPDLSGVEFGDYSDYYLRAENKPVRIVGIRSGDASRQLLFDRTINMTGELVYSFYIVEAVGGGQPLAVFSVEQ